MKIFNVSLTLFFLTIAGCGNGVVISGDSPSSYINLKTGPSLISSDPADGTDHVAVSTTVTATFSRAIDPASISSYSYVLADSLYNPVTGTYSFPEPRTVVFTPDVPLGYLQEYNVLVTPDIMDSMGIRLQSEQLWFFTTVSSGTVPDPTIDPSPGSYEGPLTVTISCAESDATIMYTTDGTDPTPSHGTIYAGPFTVSDNTASTVRAMAYEPGSIDSGIVLAAYTIQAIMPQAAPSPGTYSGAVLASLSSQTPGSTIQYAINGGAYAAYVSPFMISTSSTVTAVASGPNMADSPVLTAVYTIHTGQVAPPVFTPPPGTYTSPQVVALSSTTPGALIRYTLDGSDPLGGGTVGTVVTISDTAVLKAFAYDPAAALADSIVSSGTYLIAPTVVAVVPGLGPGYAPIQVTIVGTNFKPGISVRLTRIMQTPIPGTSVTLIDSTTLTCTFDITGKQKGLWDLVVINTDGGASLDKRQFRIF